MKITCQSCQSKYNVADEKVQGKIVKIRCRKCGATIVVNGTGGASANGAHGAHGAHQADATAQTDTAGAAAQWHVNISETDQRTMSLAELVDAYNTGVVTQDTFIWTDGMDDWKPLAEVEAVVSALHASANQVAAAANMSLPTPGAFEPNAVAGYEQAAQASAYDPGPAAAPAYDPQPAYGAAAGMSAGAAAPAGSWAPAAAPSSPAPAPEAKRAAVVKREARGRDLFGTHAGDDVQTSAPSMAGGAPPAVDDGKLTGQRNENSVLFSLAVLTKTAEERAPTDQTTASKEDSGLIDLKALAAKAESMRPAPLAEAADVFHAPLGMAPPPLGAPIGAVGPGGADAQPKSKLPLVIGGSAVMLVLLVVGVLIGVKLAGGSSAAPAASAAASSNPMATASAEPTPAATASAATTATAEASASAAPTQSVATTAPKKHWGGGGYHPSGGGHPSAGGSSGGGAAPSPAPAPKKSGGDCGCNGDLMCLMKCSTH